MTNFLPEGYKVPVSGGNYMKLLDGANEIRILSEALLGFEYWNTDNKPVRARETWQVPPKDIKLDPKGNTTAIKHFWAFSVWNYEAKAIQVLEITQTTIMGAIKALVDNVKWGNPKDYDITITRTGSGLDTEYSVVPNPKTELSKDVMDKYREKNPNLSALYDSGDPFGSKGKTDDDGYPENNEDEGPF